MLDLLATTRRSSLAANDSAKAESGVLPIHDGADTCDQPVSKPSQSEMLDVSSESECGSQGIRAAMRHQKMRAPRISRSAARSVPFPSCVPAQAAAPAPGPPSAPSACLLCRTRNWCVYKYG